MATPAPALRLSLAAVRRPVLRSSRARCFTSLLQQPPQQQPPRRPTSTLQPLRTNPTHHTPPRRALHTTSSRSSSSSSSSSGSSGSKPPSSEDPSKQPPPTDFSSLDVLADAPVPTTAVEACRKDGFVLNSGVRITGGDGAILVGGEAFVWRPWEGGSGSGGGGGDGGVGKGKGKGGKRRLVNGKGQWEVAEEAFAVLGVVWPRPDLLILGLGPEIRPLSPATRRAITNLGMRVEVLDTRNAASQYNMLATERGMEDVAAALIPTGWKDEA